MARAAGRPLHSDLPAAQLHPGYDFDIHLTGAWQDIPGPQQHRDPPAAAADHALTTARTITAHRYLTDTAAVQARINTVLGRPEQVPDSPVHLMWVQAHVTAAPQDLTAVTALLRTEHEQTLREEHDRRALQRTRQLRDALLADPTLAVTHWFAEHPEAINPALLTQVTQLVDTITAYAPANQWVQVARILQDFVHDLPVDTKQHLTDRLARLLGEYGRSDLAAQLPQLDPSGTAVNGNGPQPHGSGSTS